MQETASDGESESAVELGRGCVGPTGTVAGLCCDGAGQSLVRIELVHISIISTQPQRCNKITC